ncbi:MAG: ABC transporter permease [Desulfobacteraceae bacterium]|nr:MAG: ABC transporter permease [Desulfobacteraceae bacterium]
MPPAPQRRNALFWRLLRSKVAVLGALIVLLLIVTAGLAQTIAPFDPVKQNFRIQLQPPSAIHPLGTDEFGRDILSRVLYGSRWALAVGILANTIALVTGVVLGIVGGFYGGRVDAVIGWLTDVMLAFPYLLLAMIVVAVLGPGLINAMIAIGIVYVPKYIRVVRGTVLSLKEKEFVEAARAIGAPSFEIMVRHILPNCLAPIIVISTLAIGWAIVETAGLSFLGLGAQPPTPEWGAMLASGRTYMLSAWWIATFPGLSILLVVIGFNLLGDGLRDVLDPYLRGNR